MEQTFEIRTVGQQPSGFNKWTLLKKARHSGVAAESENARPAPGDNWARQDIEGIKPAGSNGLKGTSEVVGAVHTKTFDIDPECARRRLGLAHRVATRRCLRLPQHGDAL